VRRTISVLIFPKIESNECEVDQKRLIIEIDLNKTSLTTKGTMKAQRSQRKVVIIEKQLSPNKFSIVDFVQSLCALRG